MDALLKHFELESFTNHDHDFAIYDASLGQVRFHSFNDLGEVAGHRFPITGADLHLVTVAKNDRSKAIPLRFKAQCTVGDARQRFGQHRGNGRHHG